MEPSSGSPVNRGGGIPPVVVRPPSDRPDLPPLRQGPVPGGRGGGSGRRGGVWGGLAMAGILLAKFGAKLKFLAPLVKWLPAFLKTGGTMLLSIAAYSMAWGWVFAVGFVLLIFIHELGHLVAARRLGLKVGAPVFIPFMGALIALKEAPRNAWVEAVVGIGGPAFGAASAVACYAVFLLTGNPFWSALAYVACFLNLFNLVPVGFLDGGRIAAALSPWLWVAGYAVMGGYFALEVAGVRPPSFLVVLILLLGLPRLFSLFRARDEAARRYYDVEPRRRMAMALAYFGLIALLGLGMRLSHVETAPARAQATGIAAVGAGR